MDKSTTKEYKQVIVVRKDLKMPPGKIAAQVAHASLGSVLSGRRIKKDKMTIDLDEAMIAWLKGPFTKVVVGCESEEELRELMRASSDKGIRSTPITDAGRTCFGGVPTLTVCAFGPAEVSQFEGLTSHLKLLSK